MSKLVKMNYDDWYLLDDFGVFRIPFVALNWIALEIFLRDDWGKLQVWFCPNRVNFFSYRDGTSWHCLKIYSGVNFWWVADIRTQQLPRHDHCHSLLEMLFSFWSNFFEKLLRELDTYLSIVLKITFCNWFLVSCQDAGVLLSSILESPRQ